MILVRKVDLVDGPGGGIVRNKHAAVAGDKVGVLEIDGNFGRLEGRIRVELSFALTTCCKGVVELRECVLDCGDDVGFKLFKMLLDADEIVLERVFFLNLLREAVENSALEEEGIVFGFRFRGSFGVEAQVEAVFVSCRRGCAVGGRCVLAEELNVGLRRVASLCDRLERAGTLGLNVLLPVVELFVETL